MMPFAIVLLLFVPGWIQEPSRPEQGQILDRILAVVDSYIITVSDIRTEKVMREVLGEPAPKDDREVLDELIDQHLIRAQLDRYPRAEPSDAELDEALSQIKDIRGLPPEAVRAAVRDHLRVQHFFAEKFEQFTVTDDEIQKYYDEVFVPAARAHNLTPIPALAEIRGDVLRKVVQEKSAAEVKKWLDQTKRTTKIEIFN